MNTIPAPMMTTTSSVVPPESASRVETTGILLVVVPDVTEAALLAGQIHRVAIARGLEVLLIGATSPFLAEAELRRRLILLVAFLQAAGTKASVRIETGQAWVPEVQAMIGPNDVVACCVAESVPGSGDQWMQVLSEWFRRPVLAFMDAGSLDASKRSPGAHLAAWTGSIAIIAVFFWLQSWLAQGGESAAANFWLLGSVPVEIGLLCLLNGLVG